MLDLFKQLSFGTDPRKLVRHEDPDTSHIAAQSVDSGTLERLVLSAIESFGEDGCISDEVLQMFPSLPYSSVTARYKALMTKGLIVDTGLRRKGRSSRPQRVMKSSRE